MPIELEQFIGWIGGELIPLRETPHLKGTPEASFSRTCAFLGTRFDFYWLCPWTIAECKTGPIPIGDTVPSTGKYKKNNDLSLQCDR
jgi:hypothetical protein